MIATVAHRGQHRDRGRDREQPADRRDGPELLLEQQLPDVRHRLQDPERPDAVGAVAVLEAPEQLALDEQDDRHELEDDGEDQHALEQLDPPRLVVADLGERGHASCPDWLGPVGGIGSGAEGGISAAPCGRRRGRPCAPFSGPPTRAISTAASVSRLAASCSRAVGEEDGAARDRVAQAHGAAHARAVGADLDAVAVGDRRAAWRRRATARRPAAGAGSAAPARRRPPWSSTASGRCRAAARPWRRAAAARRLQRHGLPRRHLEAGGRLALLPAHALAADLVERQPGVERHRLEQPPRGDRPGGDARAGARRARRRRR